MPLLFTSDNHLSLKKIRIIEAFSYQEGELIFIFHFLKFKNVKYRQLSLFKKKFLPKISVENKISSLIVF